MRTRRYGCGKVALRAGLRGLGAVTARLVGIIALEWKHRTAIAFPGGFLRRGGGAFCSVAGVLADSCTPATTVRVISTLVTAHVVQFTPGKIECIDPKGLRTGHEPFQEGDDGFQLAQVHVEAEMILAVALPAGIEGARLQAGDLDQVALIAQGLPGMPFSSNSGGSFWARR